MIIYDENNTVNDYLPNVCFIICVACVQTVLTIRQTNCVKYYFCSKTTMATSFLGSPFSIQ